MIYSYSLQGKSAVDCHNGLFLGDEIQFKLKSLKKIYRDFADPKKDGDVIKYLAKTKSRGPLLKENNAQWYDEIVDSINSNYPTVTRTVLRNHVEAAIGDAPGRTVPSLSSIDRALDRNNKKRKRCTYLCSAQDPIEVYEHLEVMKNVAVEDIINFDETSACSKNFRPIYGRGEGNVVVPEYRIGEKTYSAIAAMTTAGFLDCITICDTACTSDSIQAFLDGLRPFVSTTSGITNTLICITNSLRLQTM